MHYFIIKENSIFLNMQNKFSVIIEKSLQVVLQTHHGSLTMVVIFGVEGELLNGKEEGGDNLFGRIHCLFGIVLI